MKKLLLLMVLLSTVLSDDSSDRPQVVTRALNTQFWPRRQIDDFPTYGTEKFPYASGTRVFARPVKLFPTTMIKRVNTGSRCMQNEQPQSLEPNDAKCRVINPVMLFSIDFVDLMDEDTRSTAGCNSKKCRRKTQKWEIQKPLYVEEPKWIEINQDFMENFSQRLETDDPFVLSRGKKIRLKDTSVPVDSTLADYDDVPNVREGPRKLRMNELARSRRSLNSSKFKNKRDDRKEQDLRKKESERRDAESRRKNSYFESIGNMDQSEDPFILTRGKKMRKHRIEDRMIEDYVDTQGTNKILRRTEHTRYKRSLDTSNWQEKSNRNSNNAINTRINNVRSAVNKLSTGEKLLKNATQNNLKSHVIDPVSFKETPINSYHEKKTEIFKDQKHSSNAFQNEPINIREKRSDNRDSSSAEGSMIGGNMSTDEKLDGYNHWLEDVRRSNTDLKYMQPRDKHSDLMDLLEQPFFISRGKKKTGFNDETYFKEKQIEAEYNSQVKNLAMRYVLEKLAKNVKCPTGKCTDDLNKITKRKPPRDRRGALDELLLGYDPYYVARGKRTASKVSSLNSRIERENMKIDSNSE